MKEDNEVMRICVFCASSGKGPREYGESAYSLGAMLARSDATVVYGGGGTGLMGKLANGALSEGGDVVGVMPEFMREYEWDHPGVSNFVWTRSMAERKASMIDGTDAVVALPGGSGTMEELIETITLKRLGRYLKPIVLVNQNGFYDPFIDLFDRMVRDRFMDERHLAMFSVVDRIDDVLGAIGSAPEWTEEARSFATN